MADGIVATVNDKIITGFDLRQRMLVLMAMTQVAVHDALHAIYQPAYDGLVIHDSRYCPTMPFEKQLEEPRPIKIY